MNFKRLRKVFTRPASQENDANDELRFHLEKEIEKNMAAGMSADEARRQALIAFGGIQQTRESLREVHRSRFFESFAAGLPLCLAHAAQVTCVYHHRCADSGTGDWRQHGNFQLD